MSSRAALRRLGKDLQQLASTQHEHPHYNAEPLGDDMLTWRANILIPGETDAVIHLELKFPEDYPKKPPSAAFLTHIPYFEGAKQTDAQGRQTICLSVLGDFAGVHTEWARAGEAQGWSSAYTVSTLLSVMSVMIADQFETAARRSATEAAAAKGKARNFVDPVSGHDGSSRATWWPSLPELPAAPAPPSPPASDIGDPVAGVTHSEGAGPKSADAVPREMTEECSLTSAVRSVLASLSPEHRRTLADALDCEGVDVRRILCDLSSDLAIAPSQKSWGRLTAILDRIEAVASSDPTDTTTASAGFGITMAIPELRQATAAIRAALQQLRDTDQSQNRLDPQPEPEPEPESDPPNPWMMSSLPASAKTEEPNWFTRADFSSDAEYSKYMRANSRKGRWVVLAKVPSSTSLNLPLTSVGQVIRYDKNGCLCAWPDVTAAGWSAPKASVPWDALCMADGQNHWQRLQQQLQQPNDSDSSGADPAGAAPMPAGEPAIYREEFCSARLQLQALYTTADDSLPDSSWTDALVLQLGQFAHEMEVAIKPPAELATIQSVRSFPASCLS